MKLTKRKGFNFFRSYYDVYNELENDADKVAFINALLDRQFLGLKPNDLKGMAKFAYISQINSIDSQVKGYEDRTKALNKNNPNFDPWQGVEKTILTPPQQEEEEEEEEVKVKGKGKKNIESRKADFKKSLIPFLDLYSEDLLKNFFEYWTEHGERDKKMKFEKQKSFGIKLRLSTWSKNDKKFNPKDSEQLSRFEQLNNL